MANIREIRDRIKSIKDIMKITNAMYLISSSKMKRAKKALDDYTYIYYSSKHDRPYPEAYAAHEQSVLSQAGGESPRKSVKRGIWL